MEIVYNNFGERSGVKSGKKRKIVERRSITEEVNGTIEIESDEDDAMKANIARKQKEMEEQEKLERIAVVELRRLRGEMMDSEDEIDEKMEDLITKVQGQLNKMMGATWKANQEDQLVVNEGARSVAGYMLDIYKLQGQMRRKIKKMGKENEELRRENEGLRKGNRSRVRSSLASLRGMVSEETDSGGSSDPRKGRPKRRTRRTFAEVSGGKMDGRIVVPGKEGWKTPPQRKSRGEAAALVVESKVEKDAGKLTDSLSKSMTGKEIGGAPKFVRKIRDGKLVIVPKDREQKEKIEGGLGKMKNVQVRRKAVLASACDNGGGEGVG